MYLAETKTLMRESMRRAFTTTAVAEQFRDLHVSLEFPEKQHEYPSIWVDFSPVGPLEIAGIGHWEQVLVGSSTVQVRRWRFAGFASYTAAAMSSLERDNLLDEMTRILGAGPGHSGYVAYRGLIEDNPLIGVNIDFDQIEQRGYTSSPGTPWGTDEIIYEGTLAMEVVGEFVADPTGALQRIDAVTVLPYAEYEPEPAWPTTP